MRNFISKLFGGKETAKQQESTQPTVPIAEQPITANNGGILGAVIGDIAGSRFEFRNVKSKDIKLRTAADDFTDDTVMTIAMADWLMSGASLPNMMRDWATQYPNSGYGGMFYMRLFPLDEREMQPYITPMVTAQACELALVDIWPERLMRLLTLPSSQQR